MIFFVATTIALLTLALSFRVYTQSTEHPDRASPPPERRRVPRLPIRVTAELCTAAGEQVQGETRDLSVMGLFLLTEQTAPPGECRITLLLGEQQRVRLKLRGEVAHAAEDGLGVAFTAMNQECYENLRYLIEYNTQAAAPDPDRVMVA